MAEQFFGESELTRFYDSMFRSAGTEEADTERTAGTKIERLLRCLMLDDPGEPSDVCPKRQRHATCDEMIKIIDENLKGAGTGEEAELKKIVQVFKDGVNIRGIDVPSISAVYTPNDEKVDALRDDEADVGMCIILANSYGVSPALRNMNRFMLFMKSIPNIEISRCVPYLNIRVQMGGRAVQHGQNAPILSLQNFLERPFKVDLANTSQADFSMIAAQAGGASLSLSENLLGGQGQNSQTPTGLIKGFASGMELFTSPQTLINPELAISNDERLDTLDPYRPFMSIEGLTIRHQSKGNTSRLSYKDGDLNIILHDRSRLADISHFVSSDQYVGTFLRIEYGWIHPDGTEVGNPYADLINGMRKIEKYRVVNSSFNMTPEGQVKIALKIGMASAESAKSVRIYESSVYSYIREIQETARSIEKIRDELGIQPGSVKLRRITGHQALTAVDSYARQPRIDDKLRVNLRKVINGLRRFGQKDKTANRALVEQLAKKLEALEKGKGKDSLSEFKASLDGAVRDKVKILGLGKDPFIDPNHPLIRDYELRFDQKSIAKLDKKQKNKIGPGRMFTFAKAMLVFFGAPLARVELGLEEIQFMFYPLNANCAAAKGSNIGSFLVQLDYFRQELQKEFYRRNHVNMSLDEFVSWFISTFIEDPFAYYYGFQRRDGEANFDTQDPRIKGSEAYKAFKSDQGALAISRDELLKEGSYTLPKVEYMIESVPAADPSGGGELGGHIARVHIFDRSASPHLAQDQILRKTREDFLSDIKELGAVPEGKEFQQKQTKAVLAKAAEAGLIKVGPEGQVTEINTTVAALKDFIKRTMPSITYGTNNSMVMNANVASMQNKLLATIFSQRKGMNGPLQPTGAGYGGVPIQVLPVRMTSDIFGCPIVEIMQQVFWDFGTNTDVDDIYGIMQYTHTINPGRFTTAIDWVPMRAYGTYRTAFGFIKAASDALPKK